VCRCVASTLMNLGHVAIHRGEVDDAAGLFAQSLGLRRDLGDQAGIAECLEAFAAVIEGHDQAGAVRLLGAAEALRDATGAARASSDDQDHAARMETLRGELGAPSFDARWAEGRDTHGKDGLLGVLALVPAARPSQHAGVGVSGRPLMGNR
jgi:hypothetical protein